MRVETAPAERTMRDADNTSIAEDADQIQRVVISRALLTPVRLVAARTPSARDTPRWTSW